MKYFLIGEAGVSMRGIKKYLAALGHEVAGSDLKISGHKAENITDDIDVVVRTSAVSPGSPGWVEVVAAQKLGIKVMKRSELLGELTDDKNLIAVSGMHGKTTITAMVGLVLIEAGLDPTVLVGDGVKEFDGDVIRIGKSDWFVMEACEYDRSFLDFHPKYLILTNIEEEHLDTYPGGLPEIKEAFKKYLGNVDGNGMIIACGDDVTVKETVEEAKPEATVQYYGFNSDNFNRLDFSLAIPGEHNKLNALSVMALCSEIGIDEEIVKKVLQRFTGAKRRFELLGNFNGADLIDDYGHHPTEISSTISALAEKYPDKKKIVIFWPHQFKRILPLIDKFSHAFDGADEIILKPIFFVPGRDEELPISSEDLAGRIKNKKISVMSTDEEIADYLEGTLDADSVVLTIGIPPIYKVSEILLRKRS